MMSGLTKLFKSVSISVKTSKSSSSRALRTLIGFFNFSINNFKEFVTWDESMLERFLICNSYSLLDQLWIKIKQLFQLTRFVNSTSAFPTWKSSSKLLKSFTATCCKIFSPLLIRSKNTSSIVRSSLSCGKISQDFCKYKFREEVLRSILKCFQKNKSFKDHWVWRIWCSKTFSNLNLLILL